MTAEPLGIVRAEERHIGEVGRLFDLYRQFYECEPDLELATQYIADRFGNGESIIFTAESAESLVGFVQLYPSFCSVQAVKIFILYDLYVDAEFRKQGIGQRLMDAASAFARAEGAARLDLLTAHSNLPGQRLYEKLGYERTLEDFHAYSLGL